MTSALLGGVGLFLLGMTLMTEGLRTAAGGALRDLLSRLTGGPFRAFAAGAVLTTAVQSSSATVVMTIGFVSAGLLAFGQAIGVVFGASVGTTSTSWLVAFLGLRYSVSVVALPLVGVGALLRLLGRGRVAPIGLVVAGFGLIFVGIDTLQTGMDALSTRLPVGTIPAATLAGRLVLVAIGVVMTVAMQSSSAAVATTLAALHTGTVGISQAAALVIGQNVGTTVTAALASIGASIPARRTALAHILLNSSSGVLALALFPLYVGAMQWARGATGLDDAPLIAIFHTTINVVGVGVILPFVPDYARLISRLLPDRSPPLTRFLDTTVLAVPNVAVEAARRTVGEIALATLPIVERVVDTRKLLRGDRESIASAAAATAEARTFLGRIVTQPGDEREYHRHLSVLHAIDHVDRLIEALDEVQESDLRAVDPTLERIEQQARSAGTAAGDWLRRGNLDSPPPDLEAESLGIAELRRGHRPVLMARTAAGELDPDEALQTLDRIRWVDRIVYHIWRATYHLGPHSPEVGRVMAARAGDPGS